MPEQKIDPFTCPLCGKPNHCILQKNGVQEDCWCATETFSAKLLDLVPEEKKGKACICRDCLKKNRQTYDA